MRKELTTEDIHLFADLKHIDANTLIQAKQYLDHKQIRDFLIKTEYTRRTGNGIAIKKDVVKNLSKKYSVSCSYVEAVVYMKEPNKGKLCVRCNKFVSKFIWNKNGGVCNRCKLKTQYTYDKERSTERDEVSQRQEYDNTIS